MPPEDNQGTPQGQGNEGNTPATSAGQDPQQTQPPANPPAASEPAAQGSDPVTTRKFNQDDVDRLMGKTRTEARERLLKDLGYDDPDKLQADIEAFKKHQKAQMSELERLQSDLSELNGVGEKLTAAEAKVEALNQLIEQQVEAQMKALDVPDHVKPLLEGMSPEAKLAYLNEHGASFVKEQKPKAPRTNAAGKGGGASNAAERQTRIRHKYNIQ